MNASALISSGHVKTIASTFKHGAGVILLHSDTPDLVVHSQLGSAFGLSFLRL